MSAQKKSSKNELRISAQDINTFATKVLLKNNYTKDEAKITAKVLVEANLRGVNSHGISRLKRYVDDVSSGICTPGKNPKIIKETPVSSVIDGQGGVGPYIAQIAMNISIAKAKKSGIGIVSVRNSNHYGIAGFYAEQAAQKNMMGFSSTNSAPMVVPTFGKNMVLGTNPLAYAFPSENKKILLIDMSTSVVPRGKVEVHERLGKDIPFGWATDENGETCSDPKRVLSNMLDKKGGGLLTLGGEGEIFGGHKGYGFSLLSEILTAGLSQGAFSPDTYQGQGKICHTFQSIKLDLFGSPNKIKKHLSNFLEYIRQSEKAKGQKRIYIHGEKEFELREKLLKSQITFDSKTTETLYSLSEKFSINLK